MPTSANKTSFGRRRPLLFGTGLLMAAMTLYVGVVAALHAFRGEPMFDMLQARARLGVVYVDGLIDDSEAITGWIRELEDDPSVKGVLVRINSPGGVVAPSQEIFQALRRLRDEKPVVASMGSMAASGGYYVAAAASRIVANSGTLTGSIGVKLEMLNYKDLAKKLGVGQTELTSGEYKGAGSPFRDMTKPERAYLERLVMDMHDQFVSDVAEAREMDKARVEAIADGRAFTGRQALDLGLVDDLGGYDDAMDVLKDMCKITGNVDLREGPPTERDYLEMLSSRLGIAMGSALQKAFTGQLGKGHGGLPGPRWVFMY